MNKNEVTESQNTKSFSDKFVRFFDRYTPNALVFAFILSIIVAVLALIFTKSPLFLDTAEGQLSVMNAWVKGFWNLLTFAMQMSLIMITGNIIAISPPVQKLIRKLALIPNNWFQAYAMILVIAWILSFIHWGIGMMVCIALLRNTLTAAKERGIPSTPPLSSPALTAPPSPPWAFPRRRPFTALPRGIC